MSRYNIDFLEQQITKFELAKEALLADDENYKGHEEKRQQLLDYHDRKINEYQLQLANLKKKQIRDIPVMSPEYVNSESELKRLWDKHGKDRYSKKL